MRVPAWLNPWWHLDYELTAAMRPEQARAALAQREGRLRGRSSPAGELALFRRGAFMNDFVRTRATLVRRGSATIVKIRSTYQPVTSMFMGAIGVFVFLGPVYNVILIGVTKGSSTATGYLVFVVAGPLIWALIMVANHTSARSEANDLRRMIEAKLSQPPAAN